MGLRGCPAVMTQDFLVLSSIMRCLTVTFVLLFLANGAPVQAQGAASLPKGCYARVYSAQHLRENMMQNVRSLRIAIGVDQSGQPVFGVVARLKDKPQIWRAGGPCKAQGALLHCQPDTDGASPIMLSAHGTGLRLEIPKQLQVFDDRTGPDLNTHQIGGQEEARFNLSAAPASLCKSDRN